MIFTKLTSNSLVQNKSYLTSSEDIIKLKWNYCFDTKLYQLHWHRESKGISQKAGYTVCSISAYFFCISESIKD